MAYWLVKSEPEDWSWQDQCGVESEPWTGVRNHQAQNNMRKMTVGDEVLFYHSGKAREIVGLCEVVKGPYPDPDDEKGKFCLVDLKAKEAVKTPVTLAEIKALPELSHLALVRQARLSVMPIDKGAWQILKGLTGLTT
ncbi:EVE domain-containing protein [Kordiimonas lacus]|uniref:Predicted RNA-binding protein, contains PUA-like domain n=1 Tax=Kordiimonas lacus TaxID=637679 RepID=A0A1G6T260_9PROT|nr:EVE domain-containing protein [Kordiimonas lacus]SDD23099.1 Predicted RNA-binding protein, contains PUA-like domain [Kordiimonas lacus]